MTTKKAKTMTLREAQAQAREYDMTLRKTVHNEYRVAFAEDKHESEDAAYYTTDLDDALNTARAMRDARTQAQINSKRHSADND